MQRVMALSWKLFIIIIIIYYYVHLEATIDRRDTPETFTIDRHWVDGYPWYLS